MPKQLFTKGFGDDAFKTIITKDSKNAETGHISAEIQDKLTLKADDGTYVESNPSTGEILISSATAWSDNSDGMKIKFYKEKDSLNKMANGALAFIPNHGIYLQDDITKPIAPGLITGGQGLPNDASKGTLYLSSNNQLFMCAGSSIDGKSNWLKLGTSQLSSGSVNLWNESGAHMTSVADVNNYYASSNVEDILQEIASRLPLYFTARNISDGDDTISYGHLTPTPENFTWGQYNDSIDELWNPKNNNYYINRRNIGLRISQFEETNKMGLDDIQLEDNVIYPELQEEYAKKFPKEKVIHLKYPIGNDKLGYSELVSKRYVHYLYSRVPRTQIGIDKQNTIQSYDGKNPRPMDIWTEYGYYRADGKEIKWYDALDKSSKDNPILEDGLLNVEKPVVMRNKFTMTRKEQEEDNYVFKEVGANGENQYQCLFPDIDNPVNGITGKPSINEAIRRYVMGNRYFTNSSFNMDLYGKRNKMGLNVFITTPNKKTKLGESPKNVFNVQEKDIFAGDAERYLDRFQVRANKMTFYGKDTYFGNSTVHIGGSDEKGKLVITGELELDGKMSQSSDIEFQLKGCGGTAKGSVDKSVAKVSFKSDDAQVQGSLIGDARNKYTTKKGDKEFQSNLFLNTNYEWYHYNSIGRFGLYDDNLGEYILVRESTYDFNYSDKEGYNNVKSQIKNLDDKIKEYDKIIDDKKTSAKDKEKAEKNKADAIQTRNSLLRTEERGLMTTLGGNGQTMIKSNNSAVVLRSDEKEAGPKVVASAPGGDVFSVRSGAGGVITFGFNEDVKNYGKNAYNRGGINYIDSRGLDGSYKNRQELGFLSIGEYHNVNGGIYQVDGGQQWNSNFIAIGAAPWRTEWIDTNKKDTKYSKNIGDSTLDGHLRLYSCTKSNKTGDAYKAEMNNYARIDYDINQDMVHIKSVDERVKDFAKIGYAQLKTKSLTTDFIRGSNFISFPEGDFGVDDLKVDTKKQTLKVNKTLFSITDQGIFMSPYLYGDWKPDPETQPTLLVTKDGKLMGQDMFIRREYNDSKTKNKVVKVYSLVDLLNQIFAKLKMTQI